MPLGYNFLASISKSRPEIKNRCTLESVNRQKLAAIPKSRLEIQNHCTLEVVSGQKLAAIPKSGLEIKNRCRKQHIPQHASCLGCMGRARAGSTVAAKAGADAPGGGISLCFCRRGCAEHPPNKPPRSTPRQTSRHAQRPSLQHPPRHTQRKSPPQHR